MNGFLKWFFAFISEMLGGFALIFKGLWHGIKQIFNVKARCGRATRAVPKR